MKAAYEEARASYEEGGLPIGAVLVRKGEIASRGRNRQEQTGSNLLHAENDAIEALGRQERSFFRECDLYTTLSPCSMCSGTALFYEIPRIIIGDVTTYPGEVEWVRSRGAIVEIKESSDCIELMQRFIRERPDAWRKAAGD